MKKPLSILIITSLLVSQAVGLPLLGELSMSTSASGTNKDEVNLVTRYLPAFEYQSSFSESWDYDMEVRWQIQWGGQLDTLNQSRVVEEPYRVALNLQSAHTEYVIGLQKINFGPARILRPLMWFDSINPTDPLEMTSGVTGVSANYHYEFGWSSSAWLLLADDPIGWEIFPDKDGTFEVGGRVNIPHKHGQFGITNHWRLADASHFNPDDPDMYEGRLGLDGFWDLGIGLWFESVFKNQQFNSDQSINQLQTSVGADYTIWVGNGLLLMTEHMMINMWGVEVEPYLILSTFMASYSPSMFDQISLMLFMDWETVNPMAYLSWGQTYDSFRFTLGAFYTDTADVQGSNTSVASDFSGKGLQLTVAYNH